MTNRTEQSSRGTAWRAASFAVFALLSLCLPGAASAQWATNGNNINNTNTGNVGIGTPTPSAELHVAAPSTGYNPQVKVEGTIDPGNGATRMVLMNPRSLFGLSAYGSGSPGVLANAGGLFADVPSSALVIGSGSNIPIHMFTNNSYTAPHLTLDTRGNVGIGTSAPLSQLTVGNNPVSNAAQSAGVRLETTSTGNTYDRGLFVAPVQTAPAPGNSILIYSYPRIAAGVTQPTQYGLYIDSNQGAGSITNYYPGVFMGGNVGVGTTTPAAKLHVAGDIRVDGNINAKYQDVAEWVPSKQKLSAGTVVILDPERSNQVLASTSAYDTAVAGVVSAQPGIALGERGEGKVLVATTGRVRVRVDATRAPVRIGDLLVISDVAGVAMKSEPVIVGGRRIHAPGTIIGKALEPLAGGTGEILVLLSLQ